MRLIEDCPCSRRARRRARPSQTCSWTYLDRSCVRVGATFWKSKTTTSEQTASSFDRPNLLRRSVVDHFVSVICSNVVLCYTYTGLLLGHVLVLSNRLSSFAFTFFFANLLEQDLELFDSLETLSSSLQICRHELAHRILYELKHHHSSSTRGSVLTSRACRWVSSIMFPLMFRGHSGSPER